jgi:hypothetical protein
MERRNKRNLDEFAEYGLRTVARTCEDDMLWLHNASHRQLKQEAYTSRARDPSELKVFA